MAISQDGGGATTGARPVVDHAANAETLLGAANEGASALKTVFFSYVTALTYAIISVAGVSDEQLFQEAPLSLPILDVDIPLVEYFAILPLVVLLLHLQLLVQAALISNKVNEFRSELRYLSKAAREDLRLRLEDFMLARFLAGQHKATLRCLLFLLIYAALVLLPLFTLLLIQAQFLAYHSESMMWWHRILFSVDAMALLYFWPNLFHRSDMSIGAWSRMMLGRVLPRALLLLTLLAALYMVLALQHVPLKVILLAIALALALCIVLSLGARSILGLEEGDDQDDQVWIARVRGFERCSRLLTRCTASVALPLVLLSGLAALWVFWLRDAADAVRIPLLSLAALIVLGLLANSWRRVEVLVARAWRNLDRFHDYARKDDAPGMAVFGVQCVLGLAFCWLLLSVPSREEAVIDLTLVCGELSRGAKNDDGTLERALGDEGFLEDEAADLDLKSRVMSQIFVALAPELTKTTRLDGAASQEDEAVMQAHLCESIWQTNLANDGVIRDATLLDAIVGSFGLSRFLMVEQAGRTVGGSEPEDGGAALPDSGDDEIKATSVDFRDRDLRWTQLTGLALPGVKGNARTNLEMATLDRAFLRGASLDEVRLQDASLTEADLRAATFRSAELQGADLSGARLDDADLDDADLTGASLGGVSMRGGSASSYFDVASLLSADFYGTNLAFATFYGSRLRSTTFTAASLDSVILRGVDLTNTSFIATSLDGSDIAGALMVNPSFKGVSFSDAVLDGSFLQRPRFYGSDLSSASLSYAIIVDPRVGNLSPADAKLLTEDAIPGDDYDALRTNYVDRAKAEAATRWPESEDKPNCLLIVSGGASRQNDPDCRFKLLRGAGEDADRSYPSLAPSASADLRAFWAGYGVLQATVLCEAPAGSDRTPEVFARSLFRTLRFFTQSKEILEVVVVAMKPALGEPACRLRWPIEEIRELYYQSMESAEGEWSPRLEFYKTWLAAHVEAEGPSERASSPQ